MASIPQSSNFQIVLKSSNNEQNGQNQVDILHNFIPPKPKKKDIVLEEEDHLINLEKIITRDFFPLLHEYEQALANENSNNGNGNGNNGQQQQQKAEIKDTDSTQASSLPNPIDNITLNEYLRKYNSEDNKSLEKLLEKDEEKWRRKYWWVHKAEEDHKRKQLAIAQDDQTRINNMIEGQRPTSLQIANFEAQNALMFTPNTYNGEAQSLSEKGSDLSKQVIYENTRMNEEFINELNNKAHKKEKHEDIEQVGYGSRYGLQTPDLLGIKRKQEQEDARIDLDDLRKDAPDNKPQSALRVGGYSILRMPSPSPSTFTSPLITWGEIEGTPVVLESNRGFKVPETPRREMLGRELSDNIAKKKKLDKQLQKERIKEKLTPTPARKSSDLRIGSSPSMSIFSHKIRKDSSINIHQTHGSKDKQSNAHSALLEKIKIKKADIGSLLHLKQDNMQIQHGMDEDLRKILSEKQGNLIEL